MIVDIGGGTQPRGVNLDPVHGGGDWCRRAQDVPWPCPPASVDHIHASHVLEHIPAGDDRIAVFNEAHRVLVSGGIFEIAVPLVGYTLRREGHWVAGWWPWADPTHLSHWWFPESLEYFTGARAAHADYGIAQWQLDGWEVRHGWEGHARMRRIP